MSSGLIKPPPQAPRTSKACVNCRNLKVRCIPSDANDLSKPCVRCLRGNKSCIFNLGPRRRMKRADSRVEILERKLEMLSAALGDKGAAASAGSTESNEGAHSDQTPSSDGHTKYETLIGDGSPAQIIKDEIAARRRGSPEYYDTNSPDVLSEPSPFVSCAIDLETVRDEMLTTWNVISERCSVRLQLLEKAPPPRALSSKTDIIIEGVLTLEEADIRFKIYRDLIMPVYPLVAIPADITLDEVRQNTPTLFICILAVASMYLQKPDDLETSLILHNRAFEAIVYDAMMIGSSTVELLQSLMLLIYWYNDPDFYHRHKSNILADLAVSIGQDLGIGGTASISSRGANLRFEKMVTPQMLADPKSVECRKLWLTTYCANFNMLNVSRKPLTSHWSEYLEESCEMIANCDTLLQLERSFVQFGHLCHVFEDISLSLYGKESKSSIPPNLANNQTRYLVAHFDRRLAKVREAAKKLPKKNISFEPYFHTVVVYLHQIALYREYDDRLGRSPFTDYSLAVDVDHFSLSAVKSILACYDSVTQALTIFTTATIEQYAILPRFSYTRLVFCVSVLLKMRALHVCNPAFKEICPVPQSKMDLIYSILAKLDEVGRQFPFSNSAISFSFVIRLLLCHFDGQLHMYISEESGVLPEARRMEIRQRHFGFGQTRDDANRQYREQQGQTAMDVVAEYGCMPPPNLMVSDASPRDSSSGQLNGLQGPGGLNPQAGIPGQMGDVFPINGDANGLSVLPVDPTRRRSFMHDTLARRMSVGLPAMAEEEEYPTWLMDEGFWQELVPNVEAFTGFDMM